MRARVKGNFRPLPLVDEVYKDYAELMMLYYSSHSRLNRAKRDGL